MYREGDGLGGGAAQVLLPAVRHGSQLLNRAKAHAALLRSAVLRSAALLLSTHTFVHRESANSVVLCSTKQE